MGAFTSFSEGGHTERAKQHINTSLTVTLGDKTSSLIDDRLVDEFLRLFQRAGPWLSLHLARYALNTHNLTPVQAVARLEQVTQAGMAIDGDLLYQGILSPPTEKNPVFRYLSDHLPGFSTTKCPLRLPLDEATGVRGGDGPVTNLSVKDHEGFVYKFPDGLNYLPSPSCPAFLIAKPENPITRMGAQWMWYTNDIDALRDLDLFLAEEQGERSVQFISGALDERLMDFAELMDVIVLEALRQQMWQGDGPRCIWPVPSPDCAGHREMCRQRDLLARLWQRTAPAPGWGSEHWKRVMPPCIRGWRQ